MQKNRTYILFSLALAMVFGLFFSRALLSLSMAGFFVASILHKEIREHWKEFTRQPLCWGSSLLFVIPFISGLWSEDRSQWMQMMQVKLPLLLLPLSFAWPLGFSSRHWSWLFGTLLLFILGGAAFSLMDYLSYRSFYDNNYLQGGSLLTPLENDHVRFSLLVYLGIVYAGYLFYLQKAKRFAWLWLILLLFFIIYLHVLASRTGLLAFYISLAFSAIFFLRKANKKWALVLVVSLVSLPIAAWYLLPSFQNKLRLFRFESSYLVNAGYDPFSNDRVRVISIRAGLSLIRNHLLSGTGYGDILAQSHQWYQNHYPGMHPQDKIYPSSQFILYGAGCGLAGLLIFSLVIFGPLFLRIRDHIPWRMVAAGIAVSYFFDIGLEVQYGVFIHCFILFFSWQWMKSQNIASL